MSKRKAILNAVDDLVSDLLYYDRKEDEDLERGEIEKCINDGDITRDEITAYFKDKFNEHIDS